MNRFVLLVLSLVTMLACEKSGPRCVAGTSEVLPEICDDGNGIAYFLYGNKTTTADQSLEKLIRYRTAWQEKFPRKYIVAVNLTSYSSARDACIIWYEFREVR